MMGRRMYTIAIKSSRAAKAMSGAELGAIAGEVGYARGGTVADLLAWVRSEIRHWEERLTELTREATEVEIHLDDLREIESYAAALDPEESVDLW